MTVNRFCSSGLQAIAAGRATRSRSGRAEVAIGGGTESMSLIPMGGHKIAPNPTLLERYPDSYLGMGMTAELVAKKYGIDREQARTPSRSTRTRRRWPRSTAGRFQGRDRAA